MVQRRRKNGTDIRIENLRNEVENQDELILPSDKETGVIQSVVQLVQGNSQGRTTHMVCYSRFPLFHNHYITASGISGLASFRFY